MIELKNVSKKYDNRYVLQNIKLTFPRVGLISINGPSGCGKSTLLNLLGGLDKVTDGEIIVNNKIISQFNDNELTKYRAEEIGFIFQFYNLIPNLTALENIELINDIVETKIGGLSYLEQVDLLSHADNFPAELSGGEQQRVSIARALAKQPSMLLCDEPTGALDSETGYNIIKILLNLSKQENTTVIIVTHNIELSKLANKVIYLKNGRIDDMVINDNPKNIDEIEW